MVKMELLDETRFVVYEKEGRLFVFDNEYNEEREIR